MKPEEIRSLFSDYIKSFDEQKINQVWEEQSERFRTFWGTRIMTKGKPLTDEEIDDIVLILDKNAKGSTPETQAIAKMMIPQGKWRKMFKELQVNKQLSTTLNDLFHAGTDQDKIALINKCYALNEGGKNHITGKSGNGINGLLAAYNPDDNCFIVSLESRLRVCNVLGIKMPENFNNLSEGDQLFLSNKVIT